MSKESRRYEWKALVDKAVPEQNHQCIQMSKLLKSFEIIKQKCKDKNDSIDIIDGELNPWKNHWKS